jgi:hypothetical protein
MKTRSFALAALAVLLFSLVGLSAGDARRAASNQQSSRLLSLLPATDAVAIFDSKRFFDAMPKLLTANQAMLSKLNGHVTDIQNKTGIDLRKFDQVAVGVNFKASEGKHPNLEPIAIAGGDIKAGALVAMTKLASDGKYHEETIAGRTMVIITVPPSVKKTSPTTTTSNNSPVAQTIDKGLHDLPMDIAVTALDGNTIAIGCPELVRATLEGRTHANAELISLLSTREMTLGSFAMRSPGVISNMLPLDNDSLGKTISSIQILTGSIDMTTAGAALQMMARTADTKRAAELKDTLDVLQMLGSGVFGGSKQANKQVYGRLIKNVKLGISGNDVTVDLLVPQADIDAMVAQLK